MIEGAAGINATAKPEMIGDAEADPIQDVSVNLTPAQLDLVAAGQTIRLGFGGLFHTRKLIVNAGGGGEVPDEVRIRLLSSESGDRQPIEIGLTADQIQLLRESKIVVALDQEIWTSRAFVVRI